MKPYDFEPDWRPVAGSGQPEEGQFILLHFADGDVESAIAHLVLADEWQGFDLTHWAPFKVKKP